MSDKLTNNNENSPKNNQNPHSFNLIKNMDYYIQNDQNYNSEQSNQSDSLRNIDVKTNKDNETITSNSNSKLSQRNMKKKKTSR